jgi:afadin
VTEEQVDDALRLDGQIVQLEEELDLQLPFLLPDDGYSPQVVKGIPNGLKDFVENLLQQSKEFWSYHFLKLIMCYHFFNFCIAGICRLIVQPSSSGSWTVHMTSAGPVPPTNGQVSEYLGSLDIE